MGDSIKIGDISTITYEDGSRYNYHIIDIIFKEVTVIIYIESADRKEKKLIVVVYEPSGDNNEKQYYSDDTDNFTIEFMRGPETQNLEIEIIDEPNLDVMNSMKLLSQRGGGKPKFPIRGLHIDPARRLLSCDKVIEIISKMSKFGMNTLHLHLTVRTFFLLS